MARKFPMSTICTLHKNITVKGLTYSRIGSWYMERVDFVNYDLSHGGTKLCRVYGDTARAVVGEIHTPADKAGVKSLLHILGYEYEEGKYDYVK